MDFSKITQSLDAAETKAKELGLAVSIAIVDNYGVLAGFRRMDGAITVSPKFAITKAYTSGTIGMATGDMGPYAIEGKPYYGIESLFGGELTTIAGGVPVMHEKTLVGAVGVGGSTDVSQDAEIAKVAAAVLA